MKKSVFAVLLGMIMGLYSFTAFGQGTITGKVVDAETGESLIGAAVTVRGTTIGTATDFNGSYKLQVPAGEQTVVFSYIGYEQKKQTVTVKNGAMVDMKKVSLKNDAVGLSEVNVMANVAVSRKTPVAVSTIDAKTIQLELGSQEFPEIMKMTPSVYTSKLGGGYGDSRINVRGFDQRNVAVLINGIPVNDMENGWVYWSNWAGLSDATRLMQVQRGLGASKLAISSVGGTLNIITKTTDAKKGGFAQYGMTDYGRRKYMIGLSTGLMKDGWAVSFIGSRTEGTGYIDATWVNAWSYFLSVSKQLNDKNLLQFTAIGAPQEHGQRPNDEYSALTDAEHNAMGSKYNYRYGYLDGKQMNEKVNYYHKPQFALNWYWDISDNAKLKTSVYASVGRGGGSGLLGRKYGPFQYNGQEVPNFNYKYDVPRAGIGSAGWNIADHYQLEDFNISRAANLDAASNGEGAVQILRNSVNQHNWEGILSSLNQRLGEHLNLVAGIDGRMYKGMHYREVRDLLGATYYDDSYAGYKSGNAMAKKGDKIDYYDDGLVNYLGGFSQLEWSNDIWSAFVAATVSNTWYKRIDYFTYDSNKYNDGTYNGAPNYTGVKSPTKNQLGYDAKGGVNWNVSPRSNFFVNAGYYARAPYFDYVFINYSNDVNPDYTTEKISSIEAGYGYKSKKFDAKINAYYTQWNDRWTQGSYYDDASTKHTVYFKGLNELHKGIEAQLKYNPTHWLRLAAQGSVNDWHYTKDVNVDIFDANRQKIGSATVYTKGLKVADAPQTQFGLAAKANLTKQIDLGLNWLYNADFYSKFSPEKRTSAADREQPWKIPNYNTLDARVGYAFKIGTLDSYLNMNCYNVFNTSYIADAWDGGSGVGKHTRDNMVGFWGFGRNFNFSLRVNF
ncbi:TonB-dependent receptor [Prolixibacter bellariivorans]|nr:TonB-dependent receptor [Prolixibacter bellariivorans]